MYIYIVYTYMLCAQGSQHLPSPVMSAPACHTSRLFDDSSKKPLTCTGRRVAIGRGRKQYAAPAKSAPSEIPVEFAYVNQ